jgi:hypothetical protein
VDEESATTLGGQRNYARRWREKRCSRGYYLTWSKLKGILRSIPSRRLSLPISPAGSLRPASSNFAAICSFFSLTNSFLESTRPSARALSSRASFRACLLPSLTFLESFQGVLWKVLGAHSCVRAPLLPFTIWFNYNPAIVYPPIEMREMSFWKLVENSPEWMAVFASSVFAIVTTIVVWRQYRVMQEQVRLMKWQGENTDRHERQQNRLMQYGYEHEWMKGLNDERERLLNLVRKMQATSLALIIAGDYARMQAGTDEQNWRELDQTAGELDARLQVLDVAVYAGTHNADWYQGLREYVASILKAIQDEAEFRYNLKLKREGSSPNLAKLLTAVDDHHDPVKITLGLESAIRTEVTLFKEKWDLTTMMREE